MKEAQKAAFSFESFKVPKFSYNEGNQTEPELRIGFDPSGKFNSFTGEFELTLIFVTHNASDLEKIIFELTSIALFKFNPPIKFEEIPSFFYKNAIAIMFPYVRAFVSTLTIQSNTKLLKLGLMNLTDLEALLIEQTIQL